MESRWPRVGTTLQLYGAGSRRILGLAQPQSLITSPSLTSSFCLLEGNVFLSCLSQCCWRFIYMQENLIQTHARFCSNTTLSLKPSWTLYNKWQNAPLCTIPHLLSHSPFAYLSTCHLVPSDTLYIYSCLFICCLFP